MTHVERPCASLSSVRMSCEFRLISLGMVVMPSMKSCGERENPPGGTKAHGHGDGGEGVGRSLQTRHELCTHVHEVRECQQPRGANIQTTDADGHRIKKIHEQYSGDGIFVFQEIGHIAHEVC